MNLSTYFYKYTIYDLTEDGNVISYSIAWKSQPEGLRINESASYVLNLETGNKQTYEEFLNSDQFEGDRLEFNISVSKRWCSIWNYADILDETELRSRYALELSTNLEHPKWEFGDVVSYGQKVIVWKDINEHEREVPRVILSGNIPKQILTPDVYVTLTVGSLGMYGDWRYSIHKLA